MVEQGDPRNALLAETCSSLQANGAIVFPGKLQAYADESIDQNLHLGKLSHLCAFLQDWHDTALPDGQAREKLESVEKDANDFPWWIRLLAHGCASLCVGPFAFNAGPKDLPVSFVLGCIIGCSQMVDDFWERLFYEGCAVAVTSFLARLIGSLDSKMFCFAAIAQSAPALIFPGYLLFRGALQMLFGHGFGAHYLGRSAAQAIVLTFSMTVSMTAYELLDSEPASQPVCSVIMPVWWKGIFVGPFTFFLIVINKGRLRQAPYMIMLAWLGWLTDWSMINKAMIAPVPAKILDGFLIGLIPSIFYWRFPPSAYVTMIPAIFILVPSGLGAATSLVGAISISDDLVKRLSSQGFTFYLMGLLAFCLSVGVRLSFDIIRLLPLFDNVILSISQRPVIKTLMKETV